MRGRATTAITTTTSSGSDCSIAFYASSTGTNLTVATTKTMTTPTCERRRIIVDYSEESPTGRGAGRAFGNATATSARPVHHPPLLFRGSLLDVLNETMEAVETWKRQRDDDANANDGDDGDDEKETVALGTMFVLQSMRKSLCALLPFSSLIAGNGGIGGNGSNGKSDQMLLRHENAQEEQLIRVNRFWEQAMVEAVNGLYQDMLQRHAQLKSLTTRRSAAFALAGTKMEQYEYAYADAATCGTAAASISHAEQCVGLLPPSVVARKSSEESSWTGTEDCLEKRANNRDRAIAAFDTLVRGRRAMRFWIQQQQQQLQRQQRLLEQQQQRKLQRQQQKQQQEQRPNLRKQKHQQEHRKQQQQQGIVPEKQRGPERQHVALQLRGAVSVQSPPREENNNPKIPLSEGRYKSLLQRWDKIQWVHDAVVAAAQHERQCDALQQQQQRENVVGGNRNHYHGGRVSHLLQPQHNMLLPCCHCNRSGGCSSKGTGGWGKTSWAEQQRRNQQQQPEAASASGAEEDETRQEGDAGGGHHFGASSYNENYGDDPKHVQALIQSLDELQQLNQAFLDSFSTSTGRIHRMRAQLKEKQSRCQQALYHLSAPPPPPTVVG